MPENPTDPQSRSRAHPKYGPGKDTRTSLVRCNGELVDPCRIIEWAAEIKEKKAEEHRRRMEGLHYDMTIRHRMEALHLEVPEALREKHRIAGERAHFSHLDFLLQVIAVRNHVDSLKIKPLMISGDEHVVEMIEKVAQERLRWLRENEHADPAKLEAKHKEFEEAIDPPFQYLSDYDDDARKAKAESSSKASSSKKAEGGATKRKAS